ncbi:hypothetical protein CFP56_019584 [Quercus suber]|uniref:Uncharacterized protein n=1 Tax=Quercus suber TaxID=58331 RepID=A0AAW0KHF6_QUESU
MVSASTAKKTEQPVEELLKIVSTKGVKQRTSTNQEEKQQGRQRKREFQQWTRQKKEVVSVKESTLRCNICNISCTGETTWFLTLMGGSTWLRFSYSVNNFLVDMLTNFCGSYH